MADNVVPLHKTFQLRVYEHTDDSIGLTDGEHPIVVLVEGTEGLCLAAKDAERLAVDLLQAVGVHRIRNT